MGPNIPYNGRKNIDKRFLSKNKTIKLYKEKQSKIEIFKKEVAELTKKYEELDSVNVQKFDDFPLSYRTRKGLKANRYNFPTEIQKESIGLALKGHDILGAAKTGSGKTLAFIIPILECLYCSGWSILDGLGALVITPTRELAYQIYEVLNKVGSNHQFSVALVIGGKDLYRERKGLEKCNIMICTPGRLLQHMDENSTFTTDNLKILVLDEADHILSLGFQDALNSILENLPIERQTLLFSATQTKSVKDLARLSLKTPVYVSVHEHARHITPEGLEQSYIVCEAHDKMNMMWSFLKSHKKQKVLIFMATCKQVKFTFESFCRMRPGVSVMALYGSLHQLRRMQIYDEFCKKQHAVMFATDIAARGLDFPNVNWVVQLDCPEDVNTYIHRVGRTARYEKGGEALLVLLPSEKEGMVEQLQKRKIPVEEIKVNPRKLCSIQKKLETLCSRDDNLKDSGQRGLKSYLKNIYIMKDKAVFDVMKIDIALYASSLGLSTAPRIRYLEKRQKILNTENAKSPTIQTGFFQANCSDDSEDDLLNPKESTYAISDDEENTISSKNDLNMPRKTLTKAALAKRVLKKKMKVNTVVKFDEKGEPIREICGKVVPVVAADLHKELMEEGYSIEKAKLLKEKEDEVDKVLYKERIKSKHKEERQKRKNWIGGQSEEVVAVLGSGSRENSDADSASDIDIDPNNMSDSEDDASSGDESRTQSTDNEYRNEQSESSGSEDQDNLSANKRKHDSPVKSAKKRRVEEGVSAKTASKSVRSIQDEEQLALHFLCNT